MVQRRLVLVDVDGVLNPFRRPSKDYELHCVEGGDQSYNVWLNPRHGALLLELALEVGAELVWATTWEAMANHSIGPLVGLPELPVIPLLPDYETDIGALNPKTPSVAKWLSESDDTPAWVWFDDALTRDDTAWLKDYDGVGRFRIVQVGPYGGLTSKHIRYARRWFQGELEPAV